MNSSDYPYHIPQMEGEQQHAMQQQQRYNGGGGNRGGGYQRQPQQGQGGSLPRPQHPHPNQQQPQQNQQQGQGQGQGQALRGQMPQQLQGQQQQQYMFQPQPVQFIYPTQQAQPTFRYQMNPYAAGFTQNPQVYPIQQPQFFSPQHIAAYNAAQVAAMQNYYQQTSAQPQNPPQQHHNPQPYYSAQPSTVHPQFVRATVPTVLPVAAPVQQQQPQQTQQSQHPTHQVQVHPGAQQVGQGGLLPQQPVLPGLVTQASLPQPQPEHRDNPPRRDRRVLKITNPETGEEVIPTKSHDYDRAPSASPQPTVESVGIPEENIRSGGGHGGHGLVVESFEEVPQHIRHGGGHVHNVHGPGHGVGGGELPVVDEQPHSLEDSGKNKAKTDFYQRITAVADSPSRSNSTPEAHVGGTSHVPPPRVSPPLTSSSPTPPVGVVTTSSSAFEPPVAASAPAFVHSQQPIIPIPEETPLDQLAGTVPVGEKPSLPTSPEIPEEVPSPEIPEEVPSEPLQPPPPVDPVPQVEAQKSADESEPVTDESPTMPVTTTEEEMESLESPATPPKTDGGRGDQSLNVSLVSISPTPLDNYLTPEKASVDVSQQRTESGEPSALAEAVTRESSSSPIFPPKGENSLSSQSTPNQLTDEEKPTEDDEVEIIEKGIEEIKITSVEPAQNESTFTNGGNEIHEGSGDEGYLEEGELHDEGESDEANEPTPKRIVYDRDTLINFKSSASKDLVQGIDTIPPELIRDEKSSYSIGPLPARPPSGGYSGQGQGGYLNRNAPSGGNRMGNNNRSGSFPNRPGDGGQWIGGMGPGMFAIPPPPPGGHGHRKPPPMVINTGYKESGGRADLDRAKNPWKPGRTNDETKNEEELLIDEMKKKTRGILNKLTPENFDTLVQKFLLLKFEEEVKDPENKSVEETMEITAERIGAVIGVVFEKAIDEPGFSAAYAKMVHRVYAQATHVTSKIFRKKILDQCQKEFQQGNTDEDSLRLLEEKLAEAPDDKKALIKLEIEDKKTAARRRSLGNVRFIGELYKLGMLTPKIMDECVNRLINTGEEESLECLCKLLTTIGEKLENQLQGIVEGAKKNAPQPGKWIPDPKFMDKTFTKLKELSTDKTLSSRIRFALLDVYELRVTGWKPRRDTNAPKTLDEVRKAAAREEIDERNKIMSLPQGPPPSRSGPMGGGGGPKKGAEWSTVPSNKSARFNTQPKKPTGDGGNSGEMPKFVPGGGAWTGRPSGPGGFQQTSLPPRLQQGGGSRFNNLSNDGPPPTPSREEIVREPPPPRTPSSQTSSRESSRPQTPTRDHRENNSGYSRVSQPQSPMPKPSNKSPPPPAEDPVKEFDIHDSVKQIFSEFASVKTLDYGWIQQRFPGKRISEFVDELSQQVCEMAKEEQQKTAGGLVRSLIKKELITKAQVIESLTNGVMVELPDIEVDSPMVTTYLAMFLSELFGDEDDLGWLIPLGEPVEVDYAEIWTKLVWSVLSILKLRRSEEAVQGLYKKTSGANRLPVQDSWVLGETLESIVAKMNVVLRGMSEEDTISNILKENSWDIREELMLKGLIESICEICWTRTGETGEWDVPKVTQYFKQPMFASPSKLHPLIWPLAKDFMKRQGIGKQQEETLWELLQVADLISKNT